MRVKQPILILVALLLVGVLYSLRTNKGEETAVEKLLIEGKAILPEEKLSKIESLENSIEYGNEVEVYEQLRETWKETGNLGVAAIYAFKLAAVSQEASEWKNAGDQFMNAFLKGRDRDLGSNLLFYFIVSAIESYENAIELDPENPDRKIDLAIAYTDGKGEIMEGVQILLGVVEDYPEHPEANLALGSFAMYSGQHDRAIQRFNVVLANDPGNLSALYNMAVAYQTIGDNRQSLYFYEKALGASSEPAWRAEIESRIERLKN